MVRFRSDGNRGNTVGRQYPPVLARVKLNCGRWDFGRLAAANALRASLRLPRRPAMLANDSTIRIIWTIAPSKWSGADLFAVIQPDTAIQVPGKICEMLPFRKPIMTRTSATFSSKIA